MDLKHTIDLRTLNVTIAGADKRPITLLDLRKLSSYEVYVAYHIKGHSAWGGRSQPRRYVPTTIEVHLLRRCTFDGKELMHGFDDRLFGKLDFSPILASRDTKEIRRRLENIRIRKPGE